MCAKWPMLISQSGKIAEDGALVMLTQACPVPALRGALGQVHTANRDNPARMRVQLILGDKFKGINGPAVEQWAYMANKVGLTSSEYTICPPERHMALMAACSTHTEHGYQNIGPYSLNAIFDTGANIFLSSVRSLFSNLVELPRPESVAGLDGAFVEATHKGTVTMILGTHQRVFKEGFLCPSSPHTIIPGVLFDNKDYYFQGKDKAIHVILRSHIEPNSDEILVSYPRELTIDAETRYSKSFLSDLGPESARGSREHSIYPVPDSAFVWNRPKSLVSTRGQASTAAAKTESSPSTMEAKKAQTKAKSINLLSHFHHMHGHRSAEHTGRMYEYVSGYQLSAAAMAEQAPCESCDTQSAKIVSQTNQQHRVVPVDKVGSDIAADTIVSMPRSVSGFKHVAHVHDIKSNYGGVFCLRTKACGEQILYWIKKIQLRTGSPIQRLHIDGGEIKTAKLVAYLENQGSALVENLAHVHSNTTIERRHRDLIETHNAQMHTGGAGGHLWEFSIPNANVIINLSIPIKALREAGRLRTGAKRPPTPFELIECDGKIIEMKKLWENVHPMFTKCIGKIEPILIKQHGERGMPGIYFGPVASNGNIEQYGHYMLRHSDKKVIKIRHVKTYPGDFPLRPSPQVSLGSAASDSGANNNNKEPEAAPAKATPPDKHPAGSLAMTVVGPCKVLGRYADGDYEVTFPEGCEPQVVSSIKPRDLWLVTEFPSWQYSATGERLIDELEYQPVPRIPILDIADMRIEKDIDEEKHDKPHNTRSRAKLMANSAVVRNSAVARGPSQYTIWDPGKNVLKTLEYPYYTKHKVLAAKVVIPAGTHLAPTLQMLEDMEACDVERILPRHWHQTKGHPYEPFLLDQETVELQDCCNRGVFGEPTDITDGIFVIGVDVGVRCQIIDLWAIQEVPCQDHPPRKSRTAHARQTIGLRACCPSSYGKDSHRWSPASQGCVLSQARCQQRLHQRTYEARAPLQNATWICHHGGERDSVVPPAETGRKTAQTVHACDHGPVWRHGLRTHILGSLG